MTTLHSRGRVWAVFEAGVVQLLVDGVKQRVGSLSTQVAREVVKVYGPHHHTTVTVLLDVARLHATQIGQCNSVT